MKLTIPNILSFIRLLLIPVFVVVFYLPYAWAPLASAIVFLFAALTDWLDGMLARQLDQMTRFGAFIDPVADKVMVAVALMLITDHYSVWWITVPAAIIIGREIIISALREWMAEINKRSNIAVSWIGKWKTTFQMVSLIALIWHKYDWVEWLGFITLYAATVLTLWSMFDYLHASKGELLSDENN